MTFNPDLTLFCAGFSAVFCDYAPIMAARSAVLFAQPFKKINGFFNTGEFPEKLDAQFVRHK